MSSLNQIKKSFIQDIELAKNAGDLENIRVKYLGRKGELSGIFDAIKNLPIKEKKESGQAANALRKFIEEKLDKIKELKAKSYKLKTDLDITKPGHKIATGHLHPLSKFEEEIRQIFLSMNFSVVEGPEIEDEYHNFDALNIPANHPAREMWDTFWLKEPKNSELRTQNYSELKSKNSKFLIHNSKLAKTGKFLLRTHTSPVQVRYMQKHNPPFQIIAPGRVFRYEAIDASHEINFDQLEGLMVGKDIALANLKFVIEEFLKKIFKGQEIEFRFRPSYFPFVEPGLEVDIRFKNGKWLEVAGAGMVHRKVFEAVGYNSYEWQGFAFGFGINRLAMIKYKIPDIRLFYENDLRFLKQFN